MLQEPRPNALMIARAPGARGTRNFAKLIRESTRDGAELIEFALDVMRDGACPVSERLRALDWLADRMLGRAPQQIVMDGELTVPSRDLSRLTNEQLEHLQNLLTAVSITQ